MALPLPQVTVSQVHAQVSVSAYDQLHAPPPWLHKVQRRLDPSPTGSPGLGSLRRARCGGAAAVCWDDLVSELIFFKNTRESLWDLTNPFPVVGRRPSIPRQWEPLVREAACGSTLTTAHGPHIPGGAIRFLFLCADSSRRGGDSQRLTRDMCVQTSCKETRAWALAGWHSGLERRPPSPHAKVAGSIPGQAGHTQESANEAPLSVTAKPRVSALFSPFLSL